MRKCRSATAAAAAAAEATRRCLFKGTTPSRCALDTCTCSYTLIASCGSSAQVAEQLLSTASRTNQQSQSQSPSPSESVASRFELYQKRSLMDLSVHNGNGHKPHAASKPVCFNENETETTSTWASASMNNTTAIATIKTRSSKQPSATNGGTVKADVERLDECPGERELRVPLPGESGLGASAFREAMHRVADESLDYADRVARGQEQVRANVQPGYLRPLLPTRPPEEPTSLDSLIADFKQLVLPGVRPSEAPYLS